MRRGLTAAVIAVVVFATPAQAAATTGGWLDPSFSGDGLVVVPSVTSGRNSDELPYARVTRAPDGRILVYTARTPAATPGSQGIGYTWIELTRFTAGGGIDRAWNAGRPVVIHPGDPEVGVLQGPFVTPIGRVIVAYSNFTTTFITARTAAGQIDSGYGAGGGWAYDQFAGITVLPGGSLRGVTNSFPEPVLMVVGLTPGGAPDQRVGPNGSRLAVNATVLRSWVTSDAAGRLTIASLEEGVAEDHLMIRRLSSSGSSMPTWGTDGVTELTFQPGPSAGLTLVVGPDGSTWIGTSTDIGGHLRATIGKLDPSGQPDAAFGTAGVLVLPVGSTSRLQDVVVLDGRLVLSYVAGSGSTRQPALARLDATDGAPDPTFGHSGVILTANLATGLAAAGPASGDFLTVSRSGGTSNAQIILARRNG